MKFSSFAAATEFATEQMRYAARQHRGNWQGIDVSKKPELATYEVHYYEMRVPMRRYTSAEALAYDIRPNLPWADAHFLERVGGQPLNPGKEWRNWPYAHSADRFRHPPEKFSNRAFTEHIFDHTYMQRYWPRWAGMYEDGDLPDGVNRPEPHRGIYFDYGDLGDVVTELAGQPHTRQAILPVFFPEDTGYRPGRRKPCSIFYHFQLVERQLDIVYYLRSCDIVRHFRDDIYLTARLLLWMLDELNKKNPKFWGAIPPGQFIMLIGNLHCFVNDRTLLDGREKVLPSK